MQVEFFRHTCAQIAQKSKDLLVLVAGLACGKNGAAGLQRLCLRRNRQNLLHSIGDVVHVGL